MKLMSKRITVFVTSVVLALGLFVVPVVASENEINTRAGNEIVILHTNDMHGQMTTDKYELAKLKTYKEEVNPTLMVDGGDAYQGLPLNNNSKGKVMAEIMNTIGYDAGAIGNHEFDYSEGVALGTEQGFATAVQYPLVSTNTFYKGTNNPVFSLGEVVNKQVNGAQVQISILGATTPETYVKADPRHVANMEFRDPVPAIEEELQKPAHANSELIVIVAHLGVDSETKTEWQSLYLGDQLSKNPSLQGKRIVIVDGHSHTAIPEGIKYGNNVILAQTGAQLANVGKITIDLDDFANTKAELVPYKRVLENYTVDPVVKGMIDTASAQFDEDTKEVVYSSNPVLLKGERADTRTRETNLGNLITDSMLEYANNTFAQPSDLAVMNGGGIRASIQPGDISLKDILTVLPYGNRVVQIDVTGAQLKEMYEFSLKGNPSSELGPEGTPLLESDPAFLHSSDSVKVQFDSNLPVGSRVLGLDILDKDSGQLVPVNPAKTYKLVTIEFLAVGGDGFTMLGGPRNEGANDLDVFADFFRRASSGAITIDWTKYPAEGLANRVVPVLKEDYEISKLDKSGLLGALAESEAYMNKEKEYTKETYDVFLAARNDAKSLIEQVTRTVPTQADLDKAATDLRGAIAGLEKVEPNKNVEPNPSKPKEDKKTPNTGVGIELVPYLLVGLGSATMAYKKRRDLMN